ncbi:DUF4865 family protein [Lacrimispora brassicae]
MIAMQYNISLPSDYDMEIIKKRTQDNGNKTDGFLDLKMKAYLIAEKGKHANYENQYAPFYLWEKEGGMNHFLLDGYFNNILKSFGWTQVHHWVVLHEQIRKTSEPQYAIIQKIPIPPYTDFSAMCENESENFTSWIADIGTTAYITAYNPFTWELCHYHMTTDLEMLKKMAKGCLIYDVYHIS